ncbi:MAG TPA: D-alanyl-D-alanine carboxypeptidase/D-alanyl-D-alanine-endopeptidase [Longimicrobium sp.]|nr:D-alanyl-D-alanine carboxypeptidase/D-alanyl-D-alanine-endopeptidase [Longimicrobium sp.]
MTLRSVSILRALVAAALLAPASTRPLAAQVADNLAPTRASGATEPVSPSTTRADAAITSLRERIETVLARPSLSRAEWGIEVRDAATGRLLYARSADRPVIPASNLKLVVTAAAAHHLPADYRYRTTVYGTGPVREGVLDGDLVLYGRGDPLISDRYGRDRMEAWEALADSLLARGIRRVTGGVVADDSYFEAVHVRPDWDPYDLRWWYAAPVGALGFNDNSVVVHIRPGAVGERARVTWEPRSDYVDMENRTVTVGARGRNTVDLERAGPRRIRAVGQVPTSAGADVEFFAVSSGAEYAGTTFRETLERKGIGLGRPTVRVVADPARSPAAGATALAEHRSDPLDRVIGPILLTSQNWIAETLLKTLGREVRGEGSWDAGIAVEQDFLARVAGVDTAGVHLRDGSGLSAGNRVTARALVQLLSYVHRTPRMRVVRDNLPVSGRDGSLRSRFPDMPGRVAAKTGYIGNVDSLSGFVTMADGRTAVFAIIANKSFQPSSRMKSAIDDVVRAVAATRM